MQLGTSTCHQKGSWSLFPGLKSTPIAPPTPCCCCWSTVKVSAGLWAATLPLHISPDIFFLFIAVCVSTTQVQKVAWGIARDENNPSANRYPWRNSHWPTLSSLTNGSIYLILQKDLITAFSCLNTNNLVPSYSWSETVPAVTANTSRLTLPVRALPFLALLPFSKALDSCFLPPSSGKSGRGQSRDVISIKVPSASTAPHQASCTAGGSHGAVGAGNSGPSRTDQGGYRRERQMQPRLT